MDPARIHFTKRVREKLEWNVHNIDMRSRLEKFTRYMRQAADACRSKIQLAGTALRELDQFFKGPGVECGRHDNKVGQRRNLCDGRKIFERTVWLRPMNYDVDEQRRRHKDKRVAVRRRLRRDDCADDSAAARTVINNELLAESR